MYILSYKNKSGIENDIKYSNISCIPLEENVVNFINLFNFYNFLFSNLIFKENLIFTNSVIFVNKKIHVIF